MSEVFEVSDASIQRHRELLSEQRTRGVNLCRHWALEAWEQINQLLSAEEHLASLRK
jgi:hypothetical protein